MSTSTQKLFSTRERLLADIDVAIFELASANGNGTNMSDYSEYYEKEYLLEEDELVKVENAVPTPNRTITSSSSSPEQQLSSAQRERLEELERSFGHYVREKSEERERVFEAWITRVDFAEAELSWEEEQIRLEDEVFKVDMKLEPLKTRFPEFRKAISMSDSSYLFMHRYSLSELVLKISCLYV